MTPQQTIYFPTYAQMYPFSKDRPFLKQLREKARYYGYKFLHRQQCQQLVDFLNQHPQWQPLFKQDYYRFNPLLTTYCDKRFSAAKRFSTIAKNFLVLEEKIGTAQVKALLENESLQLSQLTDDLHLSLAINRIDPFEGYFSVNIKNQMNERVYDASFTFLDNHTLLIASIQGPSSDQAQEIVKQATKALHGIRPMFMLVNAFKTLAEKWQCELVGIPHKAQGKYRLSARSKILFDYNAFWQENQGEYRDHYWYLPLLIERKSLEEIASKKRSMYRKRYDMLDQMISDIHHS